MYRIIYRVYSQVAGDQDFETQDEAIEYAQDSNDPEAYVEAIDCELNDFGECTCENDHEVIWQATSEPEEETVVCSWCEEPWPIGDCRQEQNLGWVCPQCAQEIKSHGEPLIFIEGKEKEEKEEKLSDEELAALKKRISIFNVEKEKPLKEARFNLGFGNDYAGWDPADVELHKNTDWANRNYKELEIPEDSFEGEVTLHSYGKDPETKKVTFTKRIRPNAAFTPYYAATGDKPFEQGLGPMYNGNKHGSYGIHDRYEDQQTYNMMSESKKEKKGKMSVRARVEQALSEEVKSGLDYSRLPHEIYYNDLDIDVDVEVGDQPIGMRGDNIRYSPLKHRSGKVDSYTCTLDDGDLEESVAEFLGVHENEVTQDMIDDINLERFKDYLYTHYREEVIHYINSELEDGNYDNVDWYDESLTWENNMEENVNINISADKPEELFDLARCLFGDDYAVFDQEFSEPCDEVPAAEYEWEEPEETRLANKQPMDMINGKLVPAKNPEASEIEVEGEEDDDEEITDEALAGKLYEARKLNEAPIGYDYEGNLRNDNIMVALYKSVEKNRTFGEFASIWEAAHYGGIFRNKIKTADDEMQLTYMLCNNFVEATVDLALDSRYSKSPVVHINFFAGDGRSKISDFLFENEEPCLVIEIDEYAKPWISHLAENMTPGTAEYLLPVISNENMIHRLAEKAIKPLDKELGIGSGKGLVGKYFEK